MDLMRRNFLKVAAVGTGALLLPTGFFDFSNAEIDADGMSRFAIGLSKVGVGPVSFETDTVLNGSLGMANVTFLMKNPLQLPPLKEKYVSMEDIAWIECSFLKSTTILGKRGRVEAVFLFPSGVDKMTIIFPKAEFTNRNGKAIFMAKRVRHKDWKNCPLGRIDFIRG